MFLSLIIFECFELSCAWTLGFECVMAVALACFVCVPPSHHRNNNNNKGNEAVWVQEKVKFTVLTLTPFVLRPCVTSIKPCLLACKVINSRLPHSPLCKLG